MEVYHNRQWGSVCNDLGWDIRDGQVVCNQLGFGEAEGFFGLFIRPYRKVWLYGLRCHGNESRIERCDLYGWGELVHFHVGCVNGIFGVKCTPGMCLCMLCKPMHTY